MHCLRKLDRILNVFNFIESKNCVALRIIVHVRLTTGIALHVSFTHRRRRTWLELLGSTPTSSAPAFAEPQKPAQDCDPPIASHPSRRCCDSECLRINPQRAPLQQLSLQIDWESPIFLHKLAIILGRRDSACVSGNVFFQHSALLSTEQRVSLRPLLNLVVAHVFDYM